MSDHHERMMEPGTDLRLYRGENEYEPKINATDARLFCHSHADQEDFFHRIAIGELYVGFEDVSYCLNCAIRHGVLTDRRPVLDPALGGIGIKAVASMESIPLAREDA